MSESFESWERWPDWLEVHPEANLFPPMSDAELDELTEDIAKHGLRQPIAMLNGKLLDGRNRVAAVHRLPEERRDDIVKAWRAGYAVTALPGVVDPYAYVASANLHRRHLSSKQKREVVARLLKENLRRSDRATAKLAKVSPTKVGKIRQNLEQQGDVSTVDTHTDSLGREQPAKKSSRGAPSPEDGCEASPQPDLAPRSPEAASVRELRPEVLMRLSALLKIDPGPTLEDLRRALRDAQREIEALPKETRIAHVRGTMRALGISQSDLRPVG